MEGSTLIIGIVVGVVLVAVILAVLFFGFRENGWFRKKKERTVTIGPVSMNYDDEKGQGLMDQAKDAYDSAAVQAKEVYDSAAEQANKAMENVADLARKASS